MSTVQRSSSVRAPAPATEATLGAAALRTLATTIGAAAGDGKDFPDLTSGNRGVRGYELTGARAQQLLDWAGDGDKLKAGERVVGLLVTEDESWIKLAIVDDKTLSVRPAGEINFNIVPLETKSGDEIDPFHGYYLLLKGAPELPLAHGDTSSSWSIDAYKSDDGPKRLPAPTTPKTQAPQAPDFLDARAAAALAAKLAEHAGGKLPALDAGARGTHLYEVPPGDAARISQALGNGVFSASDAQHNVFVAILETGAKPQLQGLQVSRGDIGQQQVSASFLNKLALDGKQIATLLGNARELPVPGRVEGFSPQELAGARPTTAQVIGADRPALPSTSGATTDRSASPLATRLQAAVARPAPPQKTITSDDAKSAARKLESLTMGWGDKADAQIVADFLVRAGTAPDVFVEFLGAAYKSDMWKTGSVWHPAHVAAEFKTQPDMKKLRKHVAAELDAVAKAPAGLEPRQIGKDIEGLLLGATDKELTERLAAQLPSVLQDPFAFAYAATVSKMIDVEDGPAKAQKQLKKAATAGVSRASYDPLDQAAMQRLASLL